MSGLKRSARAVQDALAAAGVDADVVELPASTRTAKDAALAIGCSVAQIAKSIVFRAANTGRGVLVIASGENRIDERLLGERLGEPVERASPQFVREASGFAIGGVPPCGHAVPLVTLLDQDLLELQTLWAAAGTPNAVFRLSPRDLLALTGGEVVRVCG